MNIICKLKIRRLWLYWYWHLINIYKQLDTVTMFISDVFTGQRVLNVDSLTTEKCIPQTLQIDQVFISISNICECIINIFLYLHKLVFSNLYSGTKYQC